MYLTFAFSTLNPFITAYTQSDFFGKMIMLMLLFVSAICWLLLLQKVRDLKQAKKLSLQFTSDLERSKDNILSWQADKNILTTNPFLNIFASFKQKTLDILNKNLFFAQKQSPGKGEVYLSEVDLDLVESHVFLTISEEIKNLEKNLFILATIVTLAPFLGLLGTVWGILVTFSELNSGAQAAHNSVILGGLSMALATTVMGLLIAIPALISYNYLKNSIRVFSSDMENFLGRLLSRLELQYRKVEDK